MVSAMDSPDDCIVGRSPPWSSAVNWTVVGGSVEDTVSYESFYSPISEESVDSSSHKSPLVLRPPSSEAGPCEITFRFAEKHEIHQVYVRSTARVYEIYYATNSQNESEYLCTVRCGAASRDEEVLHTTGTDDVSTHIKEPVGEGHLKSGSNLNTSEDDWVEVKVLDILAPVCKNISSQSTSSADSVKSRQIFYEATAEITDANPCTSLTIRLLSLQNKSCVYVDEVYVFANPVDSEKEGPTENSAQSSLMSMLVPTLLQFSKTTASKKQDEGCTSDVEGISLIPKVDKPTGLQLEEKPCRTDCDGAKLREKNESDTAIGQSEVPVQVPVKESKHEEQLHRIESVLDQLVSRMDRIENCFLRFEEKMLKPISSIEGRLKEVEQQLEILTKESRGSEMPSCFRMYAPSFSGNESVSNSFYNSGNDHPSSGPIEPDRKERYSGASSVALDDVSNSVSPSLLHPGLVVTAPEFSNVDDEEENRSLEVAADSLQSKPKPSIDDVLASALAQFAASSSIGTQTYTKTEAVKPPGFLSEDDGNNYRGVLSSAMSESETDHISCSQKIDDTRCRMNSAPASASSAYGGNLNSSCDHSPKVAGVDDRQVLNEGDIGSSEQIMEGIKEDGNLVTNGTSDDLVREETEITILPLDSHTENDSDTTEVDATEVTKIGCVIDIIHDVLGFTRDVSVVDLEIPILDVQFTSVTNSNSEHTLKDLFNEMPELEYGACPKESVDATLMSEQRDLISVEEEDEVDPNPRNGHLSVDMNYYTIMDEPLVADGGNLQDPCPCSDHNQTIPSLI